MTINILVEFEKRYKGNPADTEAICEAIANEFHIDGDAVCDYVYFNRYEDTIEDDGEDMPDDYEIDKGILKLLED